MTSPVRHKNSQVKKSRLLLWRLMIPVLLSILELSTQKWGSSVTDIIKVWERPMLCCCLMKRSYSRNKGYQYEVRLSNLENWLASSYDQTKMQQTGKQKGLIFFYIIEGRPNSAKQTILENVGLFWGQKHSENGLNFFHAFLIYTKFTFCKLTNPALM